MAKGQQLLVTPSAEQVAHMKHRLSGLVGEYIKIEDEKKAADSDFNERLAEIWDEVRGLRAQIKDAEEASAD